MSPKKTEDDSTVGDMIAGIVQYSHVKNIEAWFGVRVGPELAEQMVAAMRGGTTGGIENALRLLSAATGRAIDRTPRPLTPGAFVVTKYAWGGHHDETHLVGYAKGSGTRRTANGMRCDGIWAAKLLPTTESRLVRPATSDEIRNFVRQLIARRGRGVGNTNVWEGPMSVVIERLAEFSVTAATEAFAGEKTEEQRRRDLARQAAKLGCQRHHAANLIKALADVDVVKMVADGTYDDDVASTIPQLIVVVPTADTRVTGPCLLIWHEANVASNTRWKVMLADGSIPSAWVNISPTTARVATRDEAYTFLTALRQAMQAKIAAGIVTLTPAPAAAAAA